MEETAVKNFQEYLRIKSVQPDPDYDGAVVFLKKMANELDIPCDIFWCVKDKNPAVIMKWEGQEPGLPSLMLNSHIDVVPVYAEYWTHDPFSATRTENGNIYARGAQDMKCVGIQYIEAIRRLKCIEKRRFKRTIYLTFVPDEEIGGENGMNVLVESDYFKKMNVGFGLDEGLASPTDTYTVFYGERSPWWMKYICRGDAGHGSKFIENTAAEKVHKLIDRFMGFRESEKKSEICSGKRLIVQRRELSKFEFLLVCNGDGGPANVQKLFLLCVEYSPKLESSPNLKLGDVTSVNMTMLQGGVQANVVPSELSVTFDMRVTPTRTEVEVQRQIDQWRDEAGKDIEVEFLHKTPIIPAVKPDRSDPWIGAFYKATEELHLEVEEGIMVGGTDARFLRLQGIPALGFSPMNNTPILLHDHDEFLNDKVFLRGIEIYEKIIPSLADS